MTYMEQSHNIIMQPECKNCGNSYEPDEAFEDEEYCPECSMEFQLERFGNIQYQEKA